MDSYDDLENSVYHNFDAKKLKLLAQTGADCYAVLRRNSYIDLTLAVTRIEVLHDSKPFRALSKSKQLDSFYNILHNPLHGAYVMCISSFPTNLAAKQTALMLLSAMLNKYHAHRDRYADPPIWHDLYGDNKDDLRDATDLTPCAIILSNIYENSVNWKIEKLRDILERYRNVPRIVVLGGEDPAAFFSFKVHFPIKAALFLVDNPRARAAIKQKTKEIAQQRRVIREKVI